MSMTPRQIVTELDKYIIGQDEAKKAVAIALRNRYRRSRLPKELRDEITPKNIIMKGPTGVGKTEIARRLAKLVGAPFIKIEATKYTEVGYVGRDVESMVRDLVSVSVRLVKDEKMHEVEKRAKASVDEKVLKEIKDELFKQGDISSVEEIEKNYHDGKYDDMNIEISVLEKAQQFNFMPEFSDMNISTMIGGIFPPKKKTRKMSVLRAKECLLEEEADKLIDNESVYQEAIRRTEEEGIIFIDEMDKIIGKGSTSGPDVSREGVQRDILPIVEGCTVSTKYGNVKTDFILFIAAGAFHVSKIEDMIPELQGRFPIRVELNSLTKDDFVKILSTPKNAVTLQYASLLKVDNIDLEFTDDALDEIAIVAEYENENMENLGARRLHTILEKLLEDVSFNASGEYPLSKVTIDRAYVQNIFGKHNKNSDLKKYII